jgi:vacuolar-type H+-ATPase subunit I/STV1
LWQEKPEENPMTEETMSPIPDVNDLMRNISTLQELLQDRTRQLSETKRELDEARKEIERLKEQLIVMSESATSEYKTADDLAKKLLSSELAAEKLREKLLLIAQWDGQDSIRDWEQDLQIITDIASKTLAEVKLSPTLLEQHDADVRRKAIEEAANTAYSEQAIHPEPECCFNTARRISKAIRSLQEPRGSETEGENNKKESDNETTND